MSSRKRSRRLNDSEDPRNWPKDKFIEKLKGIGISVNPSWKVEMLRQLYLANLPSTSATSTSNFDSFDTNAQTNDSNTQVTNEELSRSSDDSQSVQTRRNISMCESSTSQQSNSQEALLRETVSAIKSATETATAIKSASETLANLSKIMLKQTNNSDLVENTLATAINSNYVNDEVAGATLQQNPSRVVYAEDLPKMDFVAPSVKKQIIEDFPKGCTTSREKSDSVSAILGSNVELSNKVKNLLNSSIAKSTYTVYQQGYKSYKNFLGLSGFKWNEFSELPPLNEDTLIHYATHCHTNLHLKCSTIKMYICGIRYIYLQSGVQCIFSSCCSGKLFRLEAIFKGIRKSEEKSSRVRLPLTFDLINKMFQALQKDIFSPFVTALLRSTCTMAYFGFLRCGEFTVKTEFDVSCHLCLEDITFIEDYAILHLKASKTDPFRCGVNIYLFRNSSILCPVSSLEQYLTMRRSRFLTLDNKSPLFVIENGEALSRMYFINCVKSLLEATGLNPNDYNGHSFRIGAATAVATKIEDHMIKILGRWSSDCYTRYIHTPISQIKQAQLALVSD